MILVILLLIATVIFSVIFVLNKSITFIEFIAMILCVAFAGLGIIGLSNVKYYNSKYFKSGRLMKTTYYPKFKEKYTAYYTTCTGSGENRHCTTYSTTEYCIHGAYWTVTDSLDREWEVPQKFHNEVRSKFQSGMPVTSNVNRCWHSDGVPVSGDPKSYVHLNRSNTYEYPVSIQEEWSNPLIGTSSLFNKKASKNSIKYPKTDGYYWNNRFSRYDSDLTFHDWDILNTKLYESKKANIILLHVDNFRLCNDIKSDWHDGGFNDLIVCVAGSLRKPDNVLVFGWSSNYYGMNALSEFILNNGVSKATSDHILELAELAYYPTDFSKFDYLHREHTPAFYLVLITVLICVGFVAYTYFSTNEFNK